MLRHLNASQNQPLREKTRPANIFPMVDRPDDQSHAIGRGDDDGRLGFDWASWAILSVRLLFRGPEDPVAMLRNQICAGIWEGVGGFEDHEIVIRENKKFENDLAKFEIGFEACVAGFELENDWFRCLEIQLFRRHRNNNPNRKHFHEPIRQFHKFQSKFRLRPKSLRFRVKTHSRDQRNGFSENHLLFCLVHYLNMQYHVLLRRPGPNQRRTVRLTPIFVFHFLFRWNLFQLNLSSFPVDLDGRFVLPI